MISEHLCGGPLPTSWLFPESPPLLPIVLLRGLPPSFLDFAVVFVEQVPGASMSVKKHRDSGVPQNVLPLARKV